jgi:hypothetical protein
MVLTTPLNLEPPWNHLTLESEGWRPHHQHGGSPPAFPCTTSQLGSFLVIFVFSLPCLPNLGQESFQLVFCTSQLISTVYTRGHSTDACSLAHWGLLGTPTLRQYLRSESQVLLPRAPTSCLRSEGLLGSPDALEDSWKVLLPCFKHQG